MSEIVDGPGPAWYPDDEILAHANLTELIESLGISSYEELHAWSVSDPDAFWREVIEALTIEFVEPPSAIRGSADPTDPRWLPDARFNIVTSCLDHDPDAIAIVSGGSGGLEYTTVAELSDRVAAFAAGFARDGLTLGDAVAIVMPMNVSAVTAYLGVIAAGGVVVSIADSFAPPEIARRLEISQAVAVVTQVEAVRLGRTHAMYERCVEAGARRCIVVGAGDLREVDISWDDFVMPGATLDPVPMAAAAHTNILFSSGTTGEPKAIPWDQTTPIKAAMDGRFHQDVHARDVVAWPTNLGWVMGPWLIYAALLNGAAIALYDDAPTTDGFVRFVKDAGVTMLGVVPSIVSAWRESEALADADWTAVRVISSTGEAANVDDYAWLMETIGHVPVIEYCGGTEIGGAYITGTVLEPAVPGRFTTPTLGIDLVLLNAGVESSEGEVFLIPPSIGLSTELLNGDHRAVYYADVPEYSRPLRRHGDQMVRDRSGRYRALGRVDDTMNLGGIKVSSADLEDAIRDVNGVREVAAVSVHPASGGPDRLVVFVAPQGDPDTETLRTDMQHMIRTRLNPLFKIHDVVLIHELPRTASHKVMRRLLRDEYEA